MATSTHFEWYWITRKICICLIMLESFEGSLILHEDGKRFFIAAKRISDGCDKCIYVCIYRIHIEWSPLYAKTRGRRTYHASCRHMFSIPKLNEYTLLISTRRMSDDTTSHDIASNCSGSSAYPFLLRIMPERCQLACANCRLISCVPKLSSARISLRQGREVQTSSGTPLSNVRFSVHY